MARGLGVAMVVAAAGLLAAASSASAFVAITGGIEMGDSHAVGQVNQPGEVDISVFLTTPPDGAVTLTSIVVQPSCGDELAPCPAEDADPGVFAIDSPAVGRAGTACAGVTFTTAISDPTFGSYSFTPSAPIVLSGADVCSIDFTFDVLKVPTKDSQPGTPGMQTEAHRIVSGQSVNAGTGTASDGPITIDKAATVLELDAVSPVELGRPVTATATLLSAANPTDDVAFSLFGPNDPTCTGPAVFGAVVPVSGGIATSPPFVPTTTGTYRWTASYSGDANHNGDATACGEAGSLSQVVTPKPKPTGKRAAALKKCKKLRKKRNWSKKRFRKCLRQARRQPV